MDETPQPAAPKETQMNNSSGKFDLANIMRRAHAIAAFTGAGGALAELAGSPKQIAWAENIREGWFWHLAGLIATHRATSSYGRANRAAAMAEMESAARRSSAAEWIDNRNSMYARLRAAATELRIAERQSLRAA